MKRLLILFVAGIFIVSIILTGCSNSESSSNKGSDGDQDQKTEVGNAPIVLAGMDEGDPGLKENFNPFSPNSQGGVMYVLEPMYIVNPLTGEETPWLATDYDWKDKKTLQFTLRSGVKWTDGSSFDADDVAYTFNLMNEHKALDLNGVWSKLAKVEANGDDKVVFKFKETNLPQFNFIAQTPIIQKKQWEKVDDPEKDLAKDLIGTGPFKLDQFTSQQYTLKRNEDYWQKDKIHVPSITSVAASDNQKTNLKLAQGKYDVATQYIPNIEKTYINKDKEHNNYWFPKMPPLTFSMNLTKYPFNDVDFRKAMAYGINKQEVVDKAESGYSEPANQSLLPPKQQEKWLDESLDKKYDYSYDKEKAEEHLKKMGLKKDSKGDYLGKDGKKIKISLEIPSGWSDFVQAGQVIKSNLKEIGISVDLDVISQTTVYNNKYTGEYDVQMDIHPLEGNPWLIYHNMLSPSDTKKVGESTQINVIRWKDKKTDKLLKKFSRTEDEEKQKQIMHQLQEIFYEKVPTVALFYMPSWNEYSTKHYEGWPTEKNAYAPTLISKPSGLLVLTKLKPVK